MSGGSQDKTDNIVNLFSKLRIMTDLEGLETVLLQISDISDLPTLPSGDAGFGHQANALKGSFPGNTFNR